MLVVKIMMFPGGREDQAYQIGELKIANDATGTAAVGNYDVAVAHGGDFWGRPGDYKTGRVQGHNRRLSPYHLVLEALKSTLCGVRSRTRSSSDTKPCRACGEPIRWTTTLAGKRMPLDPEPVSVVVGHGPLLALLEDGEIVSARLAEATDLHEPTVAHVGHIARCAGEKG